MIVPNIKFIYKINFLIILVHFYDRICWDFLTFNSFLFLLIWLLFYLMCSNFLMGFSQVFFKYYLIQLIDFLIFKLLINDSYIYNRVIFCLCTNSSNISFNADMIVRFCAVRILDFLIIFLSFEILHNFFMSFYEK